jgi:hypothetical protein
MPTAPDPDQQSPHAPIARVAWPSGLSAATFVAGFGIGLYQLARSNRPHELTAAPYVAVLLAISVALSVLGLLRLLAAWRDRERHPLGVGHALLALALLPLSAFGALCLLAAAGTAIEILAG